MPTSPYTPKPGSVPDLALQFLRTLRVGEKALTREIAAAIGRPGLERYGLAGMLEEAIAAGLVVREVAPAGRGSLWHVPPPPVAHPSKVTRADGVRSFDDLRDRCVVDEDTGCWLWRGGHDAHGAPALWFPPLRCSTSLGVAIGFLRTGRRPPKGTVWHTVCDTANCANPEHRCEGNRKSQMIAARIQPEPATKARIAATKRAASAVTDEQCDEIRASEETLAVIAKRYGISISTASRIRLLKMRRPLAGYAGTFLGWSRST